MAFVGVAAWVIQRYKSSECYRSRGLERWNSHMDTRSLKSCYRTPPKNWFSSHHFRVCACIKASSLSHGLVQQQHSSPILGYFFHPQRTGASQFLSPLLTLLSFTWPVRVLR